MSFDVVLSTTIVFVGVGGVACWIWRIAKRQTPDYDIEGFLHGQWETVDFALLGRACRTHKRLNGEWGGLRVDVDLCVGRASLLSLSEEYCIEVNHTSPSAGNESNPVGMETNEPAIPLSPDPGHWRVSLQRAGHAIACARFRVPVGRRVLTPTSSRQAMEDVLNMLQGQLQNG